MAVTPDHGHRVVTLGHDVSWVYVLRDLLNLEDLATINFVDASRAPAS